MQDKTEWFGMDESVERFINTVIDISVKLAGLSPE